eukprot:TRINITY_DN1814_c0_g3_i4.p1 TRINITY_DN1814_c0_g3~~TRINITY_DN1814_c0_g3_i4.p1  ORF type:complete len:401 (+),score=95.03 TRINITY_DN1814_c0_g3_i4:124-1326(+)
MCIRDRYQRRVRGFLVELNDLSADIAMSEDIIARLSLAYPQMARPLLVNVLRKCDQDEARCLDKLRSMFGPPAVLPEPTASSTRPKTECAHCGLSFPKPLDMRRHQRSCTSALARRFSKEQLAEFRKIFDLLDADRSGSLDRQEAREKIDQAKSLGFQASEEEVDRMFQEMDEDGDDSISFAEFCSVAEKKAKSRGLGLLSIKCSMQLSLDSDIERLRTEGPARPAAAEAKPKPSKLKKEKATPCQHKHVARVVHHRPAPRGVPHGMKAENEEHAAVMRMIHGTAGVESIDYSRHRNSDTNTWNYCCAHPGRVTDPRIQRIVSNIQQSGQKFEDRSFAPENIEHASLVHNFITQFPEAVEWMRPERYLSKPLPECTQHLLYGPTECPSYSTVSQGGSGDW